MMSTTKGKTMRLRMLGLGLAFSTVFAFSAPVMADGNNWNSWGRGAFGSSSGSATWWGGKGQAFSEQGSAAKSTLNGGQFSVQAEAFSLNGFKATTSGHGGSIGGETNAWAGTGITR